MFQIRAKLVYNKKVKGNYFHLALRAPRIAKQAGPGQFMNIKISDSCEPLLRRPFSIHRVSYQLSAISYQQKIISKKPYAIEILYEVVGKGTAILSQKKVGEYLDIIGPLGNGFNYGLRITDYRLPILVAGGMGVAPLVFLAEKLTAREPKMVRQAHHPSNHPERSRGTENREPLILIGAKTRSQILCEKEFKELGCDVKIATEDGSRGFKGKVTDLLKEILLKNSMNSKQLKNSIYACGPRPMLKEIAVISKQRNIPAQVSLEEHMACGIGVCLGCVINTIQGFKQVCKDGPVFDAEEITW